MPDAPADPAAAAGAPASAEEVDAHVRRADPDRWLAARLVADAGDRCRASFDDVSYDVMNRFIASLT